MHDSITAPGRRFVFKVLRGDGRARITRCRTEIRKRVLGRNGAPHGEGLVQIAWNDGRERYPEWNHAPVLRLQKAGENKVQFLRQRRRGEGTDYARRKTEMSLFYCFHRQNIAVVASDDLVSSEQDGKHIALPERASKFQLFGTATGPVVLAAVGRADLSERLFSGFPRMVAEQGFSLMQLVDAMPNILRPLYERRPATTISPARDGIQAALVGFDLKERRIRAFVFVADTFDPIETTADPDNCLFALGWLEEPASELQKFSANLGRHGERMGARWTARELAKRIDANSEAWPDQVGRAAYFGALDHRGLVTLAFDLPLPTAETVTATTSNAMHAMAGNYRFYVGSITTPLSGGASTTGNGDGGAGAQFGWMNYMLMTETEVPSSVGTGSVSNANNAIDGVLTTYATLTVNGNSANGNSATLYLSGPPGLIQKNTALTLQILASVPSNSLNGNVTNSCFHVDYSVNGVAGGTVNITGLNVYPTGVSGQPHTLALAFYTVSLAIGVNPGNVTLGLFASCNADSTSGTMSAQIYDVRLITSQ
jgi:hypothetical protein